MGLLGVDPHRARVARDEALYLLVLRFSDVGLHGANIAKPVGLDQGWRGPLPAVAPTSRANRRSRPAATIPAVSSPEHEIKYVLPEPRSGMVEAFLSRVCLPDPQYPDTIVASLYFDTPGLHLLRQKINSDYLKTKIRLRWYEEPGGEAPGPAFAEAKFRIGTRRRKLRLETEYSAAWLKQQPLTRPELALLPRLLQELGAPLPQPMLPLVEVRYRRRRYVEPLSGSRIALDTDLSVGRSNPVLAPRHTGQVPAGAVLEVKGKDFHLPATLAAVGAFGCRRRSFSKYHACFQGLRPA